MVYNIAWAAGIFEGEGCIAILQPDGKKRKTYVDVSLKVSMTDEDVVKDFQETVGCGTFRAGPPGSKGKKPVYHWQITEKAEVYKLLLKLRPFFGERRKAKCDEALSILFEHKKIANIIN